MFETIKNFFLDLIFFIPNMLIDSLGTLSISIPSQVNDYIDTFTYGIGYILPMPYLMPIIAIMIGITTFLITLSIVKAIKEFIPFVF